LVFGFDAVLEKIKKKGSGFLLVASDFSSKSLGSLKEKLNKFDVQVIILNDLSMDDFYSVLGKKTGILLICNINFKEGFMKMLS